jgi:ABC-2 type transport system permease protein
MTAMSKNVPADAVTPETLWRQRFTRFASESLRYWRDVGRSGFALFAAAALIGGAYEYGRLLQRLPAQFPYLWVAALLLAPVLALGSVRTLVRPADRVFLLPLEGRLGAYFRRAFAYSYAVQAVKTAAALSALWPLYAKFGGAGGTAHPLGRMLASALVWKALHLAADWHESRLVNGRALRALRVARLLTTAALVPLWFEAGLWQACLAVATISAAWVFLLYNSRKHTIGWDRLLAREAAQQRRLYRWFRSFTDVPQLPAPVHSRRWLAALSRRLAVSRENTYPYLYEKTLLRTELFGMYVRFTSVGLLLVAFMSEVWLKAAFLIGLPLLGLVQLSALADAHRHSFWVELYPVPRRWQASAVMGLVAPLAVLETALFSCAYALSFAAGAGYAMAAAAAPVVSLAAVLLALRFRLRPALRRKFGRSD